MVPLIGSIIMGQRNGINLIIIFFVGILYHIYGFVLNEYIDIEVDKKSLDLQKKPLVSGLIPKEHALVISFLAAISSSLLTIIFFPSIFTILFILLAIVLGGIYDVYGKKIIGSDFILASGFIFFFLFGASTVSINFPYLIYIVSCISFLHIAFSNAVEGGLKDADHDYLATAKTLAIKMKVKVTVGKITVPSKFKAFAYGMKIVYIGLIVLAGLQTELNIWFSNYYFIYFSLSFLIAIMFISLYQILNLSVYNRSRLKKILSVHEMTTYFLLPIILSPLIGVLMSLFLIFLPLIWYIGLNLLLYGKPLEPQV
jgi:4-hydroxybenzoate polyprenyltransferase